MIELRDVTNPVAPDAYTLWADEGHDHVIAQEDAWPDNNGAGFYVRALVGPAAGPFTTFEAAFDKARALWGEVTLAPASQLREDVELGRIDEIGEFLLEYLARYGTVGIDAQTLARRVFERIEEGA